MITVESDANDIVASLNHAAAYVRSQDPTARRGSHWTHFSLFHALRTLEYAAKMVNAEDCMKYWANVGARRVESKGEVA
jgi:hypothetical protein